MRVLSELNYVNLRNWRHFYWIIAHSGQIFVGMISVCGSISSWWKYSGGEPGFIAAAVVLTSAAACGVLGSRLKNDAHLYAPRRWKSGHTVNRAGSSVQGASDANAS